MKLTNLTLTDVPDTCVDRIKKMAADIVDRYYEKSDEKVADAVITASNTKKDNFRVANGLKKKYDQNTPVSPPQV
jgi:hypothetical protein